MSRSRFKVSGYVVGCALAVLLAGTPAPALERFVFATPDEPEALKESLVAASLLQTVIRVERERDPQELLAAARADYARLVSALYDAGYYGGTVSIRIDGREAADIPPLDAPDAIREIAVSVRPGSPFGFGDVSIGPIAAGTALPEGFSPGQPARASVIRDTARTAVEAWRRIGHAKAAVGSQSITADHARNLVDARIALAPGERLRFGELAFTGETAVRPERLREIAGHPRGEVFDPGKVGEVAERLRRTGVFRSVAVTEAETPDPDGTLGFTAAVVDRPPRRIGGGAEISSTEGLGVSAYWLHRNLFRGAERLRFDAEIDGLGETDGGIDYTLGGRFSRPATFGPDTSAYLEGELSREDEPKYLSESATLGGGLEHIFSPGLFGAAGIALRYDSTRDSFGYEEFYHLTFPLALTWDRRDTPLDATTGTYLQAEATPYIGFGGSETGARLRFDGRAYRSFGEDFVLAGRVQLGTVMGSSLMGTPPSYLFYSGGGGTVRGHDFQSLGIQMGANVTGGRSFAGLSVEARGMVTDSIGVVGFVDYGLVGPDSLPGSNADDHAGAGIGLRYATGIGPIRFDVATPVSGDVSGARVHFYIGIGQAF